MCWTLRTQLHWLRWGLCKLIYPGRSRGPCAQCASARAYTESEKAAIDVLLLLAAQGGKEAPLGGHRATRHTKLGGRLQLLKARAAQARGHLLSLPVRRCTPCVSAIATGNMATQLASKCSQALASGTAAQKRAAAPRAFSSPVVAQLKQVRRCRPAARLLRVQPPAHRAINALTRVLAPACPLVRAGRPLCGSSRPAGSQCARCEGAGELSSTHAAPRTPPSAG